MRLLNRTALAILTALLLGASAPGSFAQAGVFNSGKADAILTGSTVLTNQWVASRSLNLANWNSCGVHVTVTVPDATTTDIRYQWSSDDSNWKTEQVAVPVSGGQYAPADLVFTVTNSVGAAFSDSVVRVLPFFRVQVRSSAAASSNRVTVVAVPTNN